MTRLTTLLLPITITNRSGDATAKALTAAEVALGAAGACAGRRQELQASRRCCCAT